MTWPLPLGRIVGLALLGWLAACAPLPRVPFPADAAVPTELTDTPFYPQQTHECGPAALAMMLDAAGVPVTPEDLVAQIYLPGRHGSLQLEIVAATRRHRRVPYVLAPDVQALFAELRAGHPVLVLQDLGVGPLHVWHYAVVIGYEPHTRRVVLRSGTTRRLVTPFDEFVRSWQKGRQWALVVLDGDALPATATPRRYLESIVPFETLGDLTTARTAYAAALGRWPDDPVALFGLANTEYRLGRLDDAANVYTRLLALDPANPIVLNNLAEVMLARGCAERAERYAETALQRLPPGSGLEPAVSDTKSKALAARNGNRDAPGCEVP